MQATDPPPGPGTGDTTGAGRSGNGTTAGAEPAGRGRALTTPLMAALLTSVAYVDPGNFATNLQAGATFGLDLAWVVALACLCAVAVQVLCARLGSATGHGLADVIAAHSPRPVRLGMWAQLQVMVIMTDLAEIVGGALGLQLLFGVPLTLGALALGVGSFVVMAVAAPDRPGFRRSVLALLAVVAGSVVALALVVDPQPPAVVAAALVPHPLGEQHVLLAAAVVGATIMPHALYFHSDVSAQLPRHLLGGLWRPVAAAMGLAAIVSLSLLVIGTGLPPAAGESIEAAHSALTTGVGQVAGTLIGVALLASGLASTLVGAYTGQVVSSGMLDIDMPDWLRRLIALLPPMAVLAFGLSPLTAIVWSQAFLSLALPVSLVPLMIAVRSRRVMGDARVGPVLATLGWGITVIVSGLALALLVTSA